MAVIIKDHTFDAKRFSPLVYDEKVLRYSQELQPGTLAYDDFWDEQDERCLFGYTPPGMHYITGEHYFYLNMNKIEMLPQGENRKRPHAPYYRELDNRLFRITADAKKHKYGLIVGKPRRVGLSWFGSNQVAYELTFYANNRAGICAGKKDKAESFYKKVIELLDNVRAEYKVARLYKNDEVLKLGYMDLVNKQSVEDGLKSEMLIRTMFADSAGFEGESMSVVVFEEAGLFKNLIQSYKSTEPCFRDGAIQFGTPLIYGTGGEIEKGSKGYMEMWENHKAYNLEKVFIPAYEYYPGDGEVDEKTGIKAPSFFDLRTGQTNQEAALKHILEERKRAAKSKDGITKHIQNYPIKESEIFIKSKGGILDRIKLNNQLLMIEDGQSLYDVRQGRLEWVDDELTAKMITRCKDTKEKTKIRIARKCKVKWFDDEVNGLIYKIADPINNDDMDHKPDIAGCDSYDEEVEENTGSLGATVVYRTYAGPTRDYNLPIAVLAERGDSSSDDTFFENNVKMAVYWNYELLFEYSKIAIETYFKDCGADKYLRNRPDLRKELGPTKAKNVKGQRMTPDVKQLGIKLLKAEVNNNVGNIWFKMLLMDLIDFGDKNTDIAMAFMIVLLYKLEVFPEIAEQDQNEDYGGGENIFDSMAYYDVNGRGDVVIKSYSGDEIDYLETFNPDVHLSEIERIEYRRKREQERAQFEQIKKNQKQAAKNSIEDLVREEMMRQAREN